MKELIKKYLKKLTIANLRNYARKNDIYVSEPELIIIYNFSEGDNDEKCYNGYGKFRKMESS